jgi:ketosteroid isomerase-like protein
MKRSFVAIAAGLLAGWTAAIAESSDAAQIADAERAFAAEAGSSGWVSAFLAYSAPDAIVLQPDPVNAHASLKTLPPESNTKNLNWWPVWAGISSSGDLGFTTGPYTAGEKSFGHYFTVWRKQPDGSWKWIYDGGPRNAERSPLGPDTATSYLQTATLGAGSAEAAVTEVTSVEDALAASAKTDAKAAYLAHLASDSRVMGSAEQPATAAGEREAELDRRAKSLELSSLGREASKAGDLVFSYGDAKWTREGVAERGHYVRIWQKRSDGWKIVFDELLVAPKA